MTRPTTADKRFEQRKQAVSEELTLLLNGADKRGRLKIIEHLRGYCHDFIPERALISPVKLMTVLDELEREAERLESA